MTDNCLTVCSSYAPKLLPAHFWHKNVTFPSAPDFVKCSDSLSSLRGTTAGLTGFADFLESLLSKQYSCVPVSNLVQVCDIIFSIIGEKRLFRGRKMSSEVLESVIQCCFSPINNSGHIN